MMFPKVQTALVLILVFVGVAMPAQAGDEADRLFYFAENLYKQGEYYRAITEFERFVFAFPEDSRIPVAKIRIAEAYLAGEQFGKAVNAAEGFQTEHCNHPLRFRSILVQGKAIIRIGNTRKGRKVLLDLAEETPDLRIRDEALMVVGRSLVDEERFKEADEVFSRIDREGFLYKKAAKARRYLAGAEEIPLKSPELAGSLGAILPGAGHLYVGRRGSALFAFLFTGAFATATIEAFSSEHNGLGWGLATITGLIYAGNIFSAVNVAHNHNLKQTKDFKQKIRDATRVGAWVGRDGTFMVSLGWCF